jgi:hypothetical protein
MTKRQAKCIQNPEYRPNNSVLTFLGENGSGDRISIARPANDNEKRSATDGFPLEVEFKEGRIPAFYWYYAAHFAQVFERANAQEAPGHLFYDQNDAAGFDDDIGAQSIAIHSIIHGALAEDCESRAGINLVSAVTSTDPVATGYSTPARFALIGAEIREDAKKISELLKYRLAHLYQPLVDAVVLGKSMAAIGVRFGGNTSNSAKLGREKVLDGLKFAKLVFDDLVNEAEKAA